MKKSFDSPKKFKGRMNFELFNKKFKFSSLIFTFSFEISARNLINKLIPIVFLKLLLKFFISLLK